MTSPGIRLYTDENVDPVLAEQLQRRGYDALSIHAAGNSNRRLSDDWQLAFATSHGRAILTFNVTDFVELDAQWRRRGREHYGIIFISAFMPLGELLRRTTLHLDTVAAEQQHNTVFFLPR